MIHDIARIAVLAVLLIFVRGLFISFRKFRRLLDLVDAAVLLLAGIIGVATRTWTPIVVGVAIGYPLIIVAELIRRRHDRVSTRSLARDLFDEKQQSPQEGCEAAVIEAALKDRELRDVLGRFSAKKEDMSELHRRLLALGMRPSDAETALHVPEVVEWFLSKAGAQAPFTADMAVEFANLAKDALFKQARGR